MLQETKQPAKMHPIVPYPEWGDPLPLSENFPPVLNLLDYRVREVGCSYGLGVFDNGDEQELPFRYVLKAAICDGENGLAVLITDMDGQELRSWRERDKSWTTPPILDDSDFDPYYVDIIHHKGKFYVVNNGVDAGFSFALDPFTEAIVEITSGEPLRFCYFVEANGNLFLVEKVFDDEVSVEVKVYKLDEDNHKWVSVKDIGNFFLHLSCTRLDHFLSQPKSFLTAQKIPFISRKFCLRMNGILRSMS